MNLSWLLPSIEGIPVLMYHKTTPGKEDSLTITPEKLEQQWTWMKNEGFSTLSLSQYIDIATGRTVDYPAKSVVLTFDDGYLNNKIYAYPLLQKMGWTATFFIIANTIEGTNEPESIDNVKMTLPQLQELDPAIVQLAMHGYTHEHFGRMTNEEIMVALQKSIEIFEASKLKYHKVLAYPYGGRPGSKALSILKTMMSGAGITAAFRIGNQVSRIPAPDIYEIKRIDICGTDTLEEFKIKLKKGKLKPF